MNKIEDIRLYKNSTIKEALKIISKGAIQIAVVVDNRGKLLGTITDGDIRRGLLKGLNLSSSIETIIYTTPTFAKKKDSREKILKLANSKKISQIPIIDEDGKVIGVKEIGEFAKPHEKKNKVFLMVGGLGTRLRPLTNDIPKPMLKIEDKPILQRIVEKFAKHGYVNISMCVNYKYDIIKNYFGDGSKFGANIDYVIEDQRMGTAGALSLLKDRPKEPFFVMNGDLLTSLDFKKILNFHKKYKASATMCVKNNVIEIPYGVVNVNKENITSIEEKPIHRFLVNAGIYVLEPSCIDIIPKNKFYDMTTLFETIILKNNKVICFPLDEYWMDIGKISDYEKVKSQYLNFL